MEHSIIDYILYNDETHDMVQETDKYKRVSDKRYEIYKKFTETLSEEQTKMFNDFVNLEMEEQCLSNDAYFKSGVKVGVRFVAESMFD